MEKLWSPWRSQYIETFNSKKEKEGCVFCKAVDESIEDNKCHKVYDGKTCFAMLNLYPYNSGHLLVIPHKHYSKLSELSQNEIIEMMDVVQLAIKALESVMNPQGFNFGANLGKAAGAGIEDHLHFHIVPRWNGDTNFMPALGEVKIISQDILKTKELLINAFKKIIER